MSEWKNFILEQLAEITSSKRIFYSEYVNAGIPFYRSKEIINLFNRQNVQTELYISLKKFIEIESKFGIPKENDILLTSVGTLGIPYIVKKNDRFYFKDGNLTWFRSLNTNEIDPKFLYLWFTSSIGKQKLDEVSIGSTQPALTIKGLKSIQINLPPLPEQETIASVLSSLDDKIDLLHRQNKTLEAMAETLFRQWFIEEAEDDWEYIDLGSAIETSSGGTPSRKNIYFYENGSIPWIKSKELNCSFVTSTEESISEDAIAKSSAKLLPKYSTLIAMYGATVGEYALISAPMTCNQAICALKPNQKYPYTFIFMYVKFNKEELINKAVGSAQQNISQQLIKQMTVPTCYDLIHKYHILVLPFFIKMEMNTQQIQTLENLRDTLLPKLMSGEVRVKVNNKSH